VSRDPVSLTGVGPAVQVCSDWVASDGRSI
jgi:hypothetical protein